MLSCLRFLRAFLVLPVDYLSVPLMLQAIKVLNMIKLYGKPIRVNKV